MIKINLKDIYPHYKADEFLLVADDVAKEFEKSKAQQATESRKRRRYKDTYLLNDDMLCQRGPSLAESLEIKATNKQLYLAIESLPKANARRIYMYYFLNMKKCEIAKAENVNKSQITRTIDSSLKKIKNFLENSATFN